VKYDSTVTINTLTVAGIKKLSLLLLKGTLVFSDSQDVSLTAHWILVKSGGSLIIGSESCKYQHKTIITLTGSRTTDSEMGADPVDSIAYDSYSF
jgi:hypothetical protein